MSGDDFLRLPENANKPLNSEVASSDTHYLFAKPRVYRQSEQISEGETVGLPTPMLLRTVRPDRLPLSHSQQRLWFVDRVRGGASWEYNILGTVRLRGRLNSEALEVALNSIVGRHESLRTCFVEVNGEPLQIIRSSMKIELRIEEFAQSGKDSARQQLQQLALSEKSLPFNLTKGPLLRLHLVRLATEDHVLMFTVHHIAFDGWSQWIFNTELSRLYAAYSQGREERLDPLKVQYSDFTIWERNWFAAGALDKGLTYWKKQLEGMPKDAGLIKDRPQPTFRQTYPAGVVQVQIPSAVTSLVKELAHNHGATLYMVLLTALVMAVARHTRQQEVIVGSPVANRQDEKLEGLIGFFVNIVVMRIRFENAHNFKELLAIVRRTALEAFQYQYVPFMRIVEHFSSIWGTDLNTTPLFLIMFSVRNAPSGRFQLNDLSIEPFAIAREQRIRHDLRLVASDDNDQISLRFAYNRDLFPVETIERLSAEYIRVLQQAIFEESAG